MTRQEQIMKKVNEVCNDHNNDWKSTWDLCQMIAEWADQTMLDKACKWIENIHDGTYLEFDEDGYAYVNRTKLIEGLKQAMEE